MKTAFIAMGVVAAASLISVASAVPINSAAQGTMQASAGVDQQYLSRSTTGVRNTAAVAKTAWATIARNPHSAGNQTVGWEGYSTNVANNNCCTVCSLRLGGAITCKGGCTAGVSGYFVNSSITFTTAEAPATASYTAYCTLLASSANYVRAFQVTP